MTQQHEVWSKIDREIGNTDRRRPQEMERNGTIPGTGWES